MVCRSVLVNLLHRYNIYIKWIFSTFLVFGSAPGFFMIWLVWRLATLFMPASVYLIGDDYLYGMYQKLVLCLCEQFAGLQVVLYGDTSCLNPKNKENVIFICNHQSSADWIVADILAERQGSIGHIRYILKDGLKYIPLYGIYFRQHSCIFVKRGGQRFQQSQAERQLDQIVQNGTKFWMVLFPEGTRYNEKANGVVQKSRTYATKNGLPIYKHLLTPRVKGMLMTLSKLRCVTDAIYDVTVAFANTQDAKTGRRLPAPEMLDLLGESHSMHVHLSRIAIDDMPKDEDAIQKWMSDRFLLKDRLLEKFYCTDPKQSGHFGSEGRQSRLPIRGSIRVFTFWMTLLLLLITTTMGRAIYWQGFVLCTLGGWLWVVCNDTISNQ